MIKLAKRNSIILSVLMALITWNDFLPQSLFRIGIVALALVTFFLCGKGSKIFVNTSLKWYFVFYCLMIIEAVRGKIMMAIISSLMPAFLGIFIIAQIKPNEEELRKMIRNFAIMGFVLCVYMLIRYRSMLGYSRLGNNSRLEGSTISNSIGLSYYLISIVCAQIWCAFTEDKAKKRIFYLVSIIPNGVLILYSGVRKAIILPLLFMIILWLWATRKSLKRGLKIFLVFLLAIGTIYYAILTVPGLYNILGARMGALLNRSSAGKDYSLVSRGQLALAAIRGFFDNPLFGKGAYGAREYFLNAPGLLHNTTHPHNNYLNLLVIGGLPLFLIYYAVPFIYGVRILKRRPEMESPVFYLMAYFFVILVSDFGTSSYNVSLFTFFIGLMIYIGCRGQKANSVL